MTEAMEPAKRWGEAVLRSMRERGMNDADVSRVSGVSHTTIATWRKGYKLANLHQGLDVATALNDDGLERLLWQLRTRACLSCGTPFVAIRSPDARYCARSNCRAVKRQEARNARHMAERREVQRAATQSLRLIQKAVDAFCRGCEPEGVCRDAECALRGFSPLRLDRRTA